MKTENYFNTLYLALDEAVRRATAQGAEFDGKELDFWLACWNGGVSYGQTIRHSCPVFKLKGKIQYNRAMTVVIYRMESGRYELTTYVN